MYLCIVVRGNNSTILVLISVYFTHCCFIANSDIKTLETRSINTNYQQQY